MNIGKLFGWGIVLLIAIQLIPYGKNHSNPPVTGEPAWDSDRTRELFFRACRDCHSNETIWPWYSNIAPASWLAQFDVEHGREEFNVSEWGRPGENEGDEAAEEVRKGKMPPFFYLPLHPEASLSDSEKQELVNGLVATFGEKDERGEKNDERE
ncbi:cytochrome C [Prosthecochloris sp. GSB1]|uniref:heme-binding domain-containing protein n=1 Tax=Prosthecochloris sp. GSB1 TaxID=281093 RepID=UPI000B8CA09B|nr:heme-binding domain-containing protein [Prosthecochloris sp. GSB1]ASQ91098.1 cytochrome C [Prosthecochloris sp. GSB1]